MHTRVSFSRLHSDESYTFWETLANLQIVLFAFSQWLRVWPRTCSVEEDTEACFCDTTRCWRPIAGHQIWMERILLTEIPSSLIVLLTLRAQERSCLMDYTRIKSRDFDRHWTTCN